MMNLMHRQSPAAPVVLLLALGLVGACSRPPAPPPASPPPEPIEEPAPSDDLPPPQTEPPPPAPGECAEGGRLWDGKPKDCSYEVAGCCYDSAQNACAAAGCGAEQCLVLESYPAQIRCDG